MPAYTFTPPFVQRRVPVIPPVNALMNFGLAVLRIDGQWVEAEYPSEQQIDAADYYFPGGRENPVSHDAAAALVQGGYTVDGWDGPLPSDNQAGTAVVGTALVG